MVKRYDVVLINLDPAQGMECKKKRPCVVISPDDMNSSLHTIVIAPMTSTLRGWMFRPLVTGEHRSELALDQMRAVDKSRVIKTLGHLSELDQKAVYSVLKDFFA